jgi:hypothetical protein
MVEISSDLFTKLVEALSLIPEINRKLDALEKPLESIEGDLKCILSDLQSINSPQERIFEADSAIETQIVRSNAICEANLSSPMKTAKVKRGIKHLRKQRTATQATKMTKPRKQQSKPTCKFKSANLSEISRFTNHEGQKDQSQVINPKHQFIKIQEIDHQLNERCVTNVFFDHRVKYFCSSAA